jgi:hypothetical protein
MYVLNLLLTVLLWPFRTALAALWPVGVVHAAHGDPNLIGAFCYIVPADELFETTPTSVELCLAACPDDLGYQLELNYIGFRANTLPVDAADAVTADIEWIDDSAADAVANLVAAYNFLAANNTVLINNTVWQGSQILDPGDVVNVESGVTTPTTASEGAAFVVAGRILNKSG